MNIDLQALSSGRKSTLSVSTFVLHSTFFFPNPLFAFRQRDIADAEDKVSCAETLFYLNTFAFSSEVTPEKEAI